MIDLFSNSELYSTNRRTVTAKARIELKAPLNCDTEDGLQVRVSTRWRTTAAPTSIEVWSPVTIEGFDHQHSMVTTTKSVASSPSSADPFNVAW